MIHVAGTNGKGSVLQISAGAPYWRGETHRVVYIPHLMTIRERICIGEEMISKRRFLTVFEETLEAVRKMETDGLSHPTYFEFLFGMAMKL